MANVFIHFEPIGPVGEEINIESDLPKYVIRGEYLPDLLASDGNRKTSSKHG